MTDGAERFRELCLDSNIRCNRDGDSIGTYNEKRFHRIFKRFVTDREECFEVKLGGYVADVVCDGEITEIQTGSLRPLSEKLCYYLSDTELSVTVVKPIIVNKRLLRADKLTGELIGEKCSPKHGRPTDILPELYYVAEHIGNERFCLRLALTEADEYRYSERVRYRKTGAYDNELYPTALIGLIDVRTVGDVVALLPNSLSRASTFTAAEFSRATALRGRRLSFALLTLIDLGILERQKASRGYAYSLSRQSSAAVE